MPSQHISGRLIWACRNALLVLALLVGAGCDLSNPSKGPEYEKGFNVGVATAQREAQRGKRWTSGPAPTPARGKSPDWVRGYNEGWKATIQAAEK